MEATINTEYLFQGQAKLREYDNRNEVTLTEPKASQ